MISLWKTIFMGNEIINEEYLHSELTGRIIKCAYAVHSFFGNGFQEVIYQRAMQIEMNLEKINFGREVEMEIFYKGFDIGTRRVDFFVEDKILVELKAVIRLEDVHLAQAINYLEAFNKEVGLLINFGAKSCEIKRLQKPLRKKKS